MRHSFTAAPRLRARALAGVLLLTGTTLGAQAATGTVTGTVRSTDGGPLSTAIVMVSGSARGANVKSDGSYRIVLPAGRYELRARLLGYVAARESVTVAAGETVSRDFRLARAATNLEAVAIIGTRGEERTVVSAPVPIDVLNATEIRQTGRTETAQMIQAVAPSFNFPRTSIGDGTDHMRPATLRGLAPDQTLVLINGKRRHAGALVNLNGFVGRGSQPVDLNAIPASMIERIEVLRDGAAAQYGSDAISGVLNIVLKSRGPGEITTTAGQYVTTYNRKDDIAWPAKYEGERKVTDGKSAQFAVNKGATFGESGYFFGGLEVRDRGETNRTLPDYRTQFAGILAARNSEAARINHRQGDAYLHDVSGFVNAGTTLASGVEAYAFGGVSKRYGDAAGFWRRSLDDRTLRNLYPDGFLPVIQSDIWDGSLTAGLKGALSGWQWDLSGVYGQNAFAYTVTHSANVSLGPNSPTTFDAGKLRNGQFTANLDLFREVDAPWSRALKIAAGAEFRRDAYTITAGEEASWKNGNAPVIGPDGQVKMRTATDTLRGAPGAQVFPGFAPADAGAHSRSNVAGYVDLESNLLDRLLVSVAGRAENYSDFGSTVTGKVASRLEIARAFAIRGAVSTGFRAPTIGQEFFTSTATNFISGIPFDIKTLAATSDAAKVLGATPLEPETSRNLSLGFVLEPLRTLSFTVDAYRIDIDDRIVLSGNFTQTKVQDLFRQNGFPGIGGARYFTNAIDTRTKGVDVVGSFGYRFPNTGILKLTAGYNRNETEVTRVSANPPQLAGFESTLFDREQRARIEVGQPKDNILLSGSYGLKALTLNAQTHRYGEVTAYSAAGPTNAFGPLDQTFGAKWITDASISFSLRERYTLSVGADNLFDVYPDRNNNVGDTAGFTNGGTANFGIFPYAGISPFGFNGRYIYTRLSLGM